MTTEYLPRTTMRTEWMMVRSRCEFEAAIRAAGLRVCEVRAYAQKLPGSDLDQQSRKFFIDFLAQVERAALGFGSRCVCRGRRLARGRPHP